MKRLWLAAILLFTTLCGAQTSLKGSVSVAGTVSIGGVGTATVLTAITISPATASIVIGGTRTYTALGTFTGGGQSDITSLVAWSSNNTSVANNTCGLSPGC